jgi:hypothetical protein
LQRLRFNYSDPELSKTQGWLMVAAALEEYLEGRQDGVRPGLKRLLWVEEAGRRLGLNVSRVERLVEPGRLRRVASVREGSASGLILSPVRAPQEKSRSHEPAMDINLGYTGG